MNICIIHYYNKILVIMQNRGRLADPDDFEHAVKVNILNILILHV